MPERSEMRDVWSWFCWIVSIEYGCGLLNILRVYLVELGFWKKKTAVGCEP